MNEPHHNQCWKQSALLGLLLVAGTVIAYQPAWNAGFIWDDDAYVTRNSLLTAPDGLKRIWFSLDSPSQYFPLTYTSFRVERALWGLNPAGYHWVNLLLHAINALLAWRLLARLKIPGAWLAAAIFALHPVNVESVAWITELKNVQSLFFCLLALLTWVEFVESDRRRWRWYGMTLVFYALALLSKTTACTLPAALLLIWWLKQEPIDRRRLAHIVPFVIGGVAMGLVSMWWERHHQGTEGEVFKLGPLERVLIASRAVWFYAGKLAWPANLTFNYPRWVINPSAPLAYVGLITGAGMGGLIYYLRRFVGRSVEVAAMYYVATLAPLLGFIMLYTFHYSFVADHYQYMASLGPIALVAAGLTAWFWKSADSGATASGSAAALRRSVSESARGPAQSSTWRSFNEPFVRIAFCSVLLITLGILTWRQCGMYQDAETLWRTTLERNPDSFMANNNLGELLLKNGRTDEAMKYFQKTLKIKPDSAQAHCNLGVAYFQAGRINEAIREYQTVLELQPRIAEAHKNLGDAYLQTGNLDDAIAHSLKAVELKPDFAEAHHNAGNAFLQKGQLNEAIFHLRKAVEIRPEYPDALNNLGVALIQKGDAPAAMALFQRALDLQPDFAEAHNNLGKLQLQNGNVREALAHYRAALALQPNDPDTLSNLAWTLATWPDAAVRDGARAVELAQRANQLSGGRHPVMLSTLAAAYAENGRFTDAINAAQQALQSARTDAAFSGRIRSWIKRYQAGVPIRDNGKMEVAPDPP